MVVRLLERAMLINYAKSLLQALSSDMEQQKKEVGNICELIANRHEFMSF